MKRRAFLLLCFALVLAIALVTSAGCAKKTATVEATPTPQTSAAPQASEPPQAAGGESPQAGASESPQAPAGAETPAATPTGPVNLLTLEQGTILREWPSTDEGVANIVIYGLLSDYAWQSKPKAPGPFAFVFELAAPARIDSLGFVAYQSDSEAPNAAQSVKVEGSEQGADSGYTDIGNYTLKATSDEQDFSLSKPATARWLRVTIAQRSSDFTSIRKIMAYGQLQLPARGKSLAGVWLYDDSALSSGDQLLSSGGRLPAAPDPKLVNKEFQLAQIVEQNGVLRAGLCHPYGGTMVGPTFSATQSGSAVTWQDTVGGGNAVDFVVNAEGTIMAAAPYYVMIRLPAGPTCTQVEPPVGSGRHVLLLSPNGRMALYYYPSAHTELFPGFHFTPLAAELFTPDWLAGVDTVVMSCVDQAAKRLAPWQAAALVDFISAGHKLIIYDADKCGQDLDYSFLPYQFNTSNPGAIGARSKNFYLVESNTLGSDKTDPQHFLDVQAYLAEVNQQIGDANTVTTSDPHWCGHLFGTNVLGVNGFMQMYAVLGHGLIIYNGLDQDNAPLPELQRIERLELQQPVPALLPCAELVASKFLIEPSQQAPFVAGRAATMKFPLQVLANQGYAGTVSLSPKATTDATWKTSLSVSQVTLKGGAAPLTLSIDVPANAAPGGHEFSVNGDDGQGHTASASIVLVATIPPKVVKVKPVTRGCTERLSIGADALFAFGEATLTPVAQKTLAGLGPTIKAAGKHPVRINGYTDSIGSDAYNQALSEQRAKTVHDWLASHGYIKALTPITGFGKRDPVAPNTNPNGSDNPQGRAKNRRVEVLIDTCH